MKAVELAVALIKDGWRKISITFKTPLPQLTTALWGRTDGAHLCYGLATATMQRDVSEKLLTRLILRLTGRTRARWG